MTGSTKFPVRSIGSYIFQSGGGYQVRSTVNIDFIQSSKALTHLVSIRDKKLNLSFFHRENTHPSMGEIRLWASEWINRFASNLRIFPIKLKAI